MSVDVSRWSTRVLRAPPELSEISLRALLALGLDPDERIPRGIDARCGIRIAHERAIRIHQVEAAAEDLEDLRHPRAVADGQRDDVDAQSVGEVTGGELAHHHAAAGVTAERGAGPREEVGAREECAAAAGLALRDSEVVPVPVVVDGSGSALVVDAQRPADRRRRRNELARVELDRAEVVADPA